MLVFGGAKLTVARVYTSLAFFGVLRFPLMMVPRAVALAVEAMLSVERLERFLDRPDVVLLPPVNLAPTPAHGHGGSTGGGLHRSLPPGGDAAAAIHGAQADPNAALRAPLLRADAAAAGSARGGDRDDGDGDAPEYEFDPLAPPTPPGVRVAAADLAWPNGAPLLRGVDFACAPGELVVVVGATGAGKSGLLGALLGELPPPRNAAAGGRVALDGRVAYAAQSAWIQNASLRDNVLFGAPFDAARYADALERCALLPDLDALPAGDATEIGEKGINLSGGQKQRVALARAVYADADVYLLDDCLSAVDAHVAHHLFSRCVRGGLRDRGKAVLLVSHNLATVTRADKVRVSAPATRPRWWRQDSSL